MTLSKYAKILSIRLHPGEGKTLTYISRYTFAFLVCHTLNLINVIVNINLLNTFFEGRFTEFGTRWSEILILFQILFCKLLYKSKSCFKLYKSMFHLHIVVQIEPLCRWLESSEKQHSVLPDIFPRVIQIIQNWICSQYIYLEILLKLV